jgi:hypothetical protein
VQTPDNRSENNKVQVHFYPNPASNFINFEFKEPLEPGAMLQVFSFLGRQVASVPVQSQRVTVNVSGYFRGIYVFQLRLPSGKVVETNKFQVNR